MKMLLSAMALTLLASAPVEAAAVKLGDLTIDAAWARATPKGAAVGAGYLSVQNDGATPDRLTAVSVDFADAQVHEMKMKNGVMEMRAVEGGLEIPAHGAVKLAPGGYHVMFVGLKHPLVKGETVKATLTFANAGQIALDLPVLAIGAPGPAASHDMKGMKM